MDAKIEKLTTLLADLGAILHEEREVVKLRTEWLEQLKKELVETKVELQFAKAELEEQKERIAKKEIEELGLSKCSLLKERKNA